MLGEIVLIFAFAFGILSLVMYVFTFRHYENTLKLARNSYNIHFGLIVVAALLLLKAIITHDYSLSYVYEFSGNDLSGGLLLSTFYAGQQGSFLLWLLFASIIGLFLKRNLRSLPRYESSVMIFYTLNLVFLNILLLPGLKDPFASIFSDVKYISDAVINKFYLTLPEIQKFIYSSSNQAGRFVKFSPELKNLLDSLNIPVTNFIVNGQGLNPLLRNFWMEIHPPVLFLGFALAAVPFSFAMSAFLRDEYRTWINKSLPWLLAAAGILGAGIMIGGYWAYGVLGWGGYWGWDPVENSSLIPWLIEAALIHTLIVQMKHQNSYGTPKFVKTNIAFAILSYVLVIYSTFLTRSGILSDASVHSFVEPGMLTYVALVAFILTFVLSAFYFFMLRWNKLNAEGDEEVDLVSRESGLFLAASVLAGIALIIFVGTSAPIFSKAVEISFYNSLNKPLAILGVLLLGISLYLSWGKNRSNHLLKTGLIVLFISITLTLVIISFTGLKGILNYLLLFGAIFSFSTNLLFFLKNAKLKLIFTGGQIAHMGIALFLLGVVLNGNLIAKYSKDLPKGEIVKAGDYKLKYLGHDRLPNSVKYAFNVKIIEGEKEYFASPVMYRSSYNDNLMREPDIVQGWSRDIYVSPLGLKAAVKESANVVKLKVGQTKKIENRLIKLVKINFKRGSFEYLSEGRPSEAVAEILVENKGKSFVARPEIKIDKNQTTSRQDTIKELNKVFKLNKLTASGEIILRITEKGGKEKNKPEELSVQLSIEPFISLIWSGVVLIVIGFFVSAYRRRRS